MRRSRSWADAELAKLFVAKKFRNRYLYPVINTEVQIPEGAFLMTPELSCQVTFPLTQLGTTFTQGVSAGQSIPVRWGTFRCNIVNKFFFQLRGF